MRRLALVVFVLVAIVLAADPAAAKGPSEAMLDGPGIGEPIDLRQELGDTAFWDETSGLGYAAAIGFGDLAGDPSLALPADELGPEYGITWGSFPSSGDEFALIVELYPWAADGPLLHVPGGQRTFMGFHGAASATPGMGDTTTDGWYPLTEPALDTLRSVGLPTKPPSVGSVGDGTGPVKDGDGVVGAGTAVLLGGVALAVVLLGVLYRRRRVAPQRAAVLPA